MSEAIASPPPVPKAPSRGAFGRRLAEGFAGSAAGFLFSCFFGPGLIGWWYEPPSKDAFSCAGTVKSALGQFVTMQLTSAIAGTVFVVVILFFGRRWWDKRKASRPAPPPAQAAP